MGKKQHQKDKLYLTCTEWSNIYGGKKRDTVDSKDAKTFKRLPFDHCALSLQPFHHPLCTPNGIVYDLMNIVPFLKKYGIDPVSGKKLEFGALVKLNFTKNSDGKYHCPVMFKVFNENTQIAAIRTSGNVFSYEAIEQLNLKSKNFTDLLSGETFTKKDIIMIQDPTNLEKQNFTSFHHLINNLKVEEEDDETISSSSGGRPSKLKAVNSITQDILNELKETEAKSKESKSEKEENKIEKADTFNAAHYSTGAVAASSTSTSVSVSTQHEAAVLDEDVVRYKRIKKKGYIRLETNFGTLNLELHCDITPKACENFMKLAEKGYYNGTVFHRSIKNFMIQGGDPTATGKGGDSFWGKPFKDEFRPNLSHKGRGVLSMANSGPNTNKSQFFITYRSCVHLDKKHSIFGRVVGGLDTLNSMEKIETDKDDRPVKEITLIKATVFVDPFQEVDEQLAREREEEQLKRKAEKANLTPNVPSKKLNTYVDGIGKYINLNNRMTS